MPEQKKTQTAVPIIDVYWEGPFTPEKIDSKLRRDGHCLYQVYGSHPVYGTDSLLYIGKTEEQGVQTRIGQHKWIKNQVSDCKIYIASCDVFTSWGNRDKQGSYGKYQPVGGHLPSIDNIESLLIFAHQPSYNSKSLKSTHFAGKPFRLFNSYRRASLMPEISSQFYADSLPHPEDEVNTK